MKLKKKKITIKIKKPRMTANLNILGWSYSRLQQNQVHHKNQEH
jgi:hypothetical protein